MDYFENTTRITEDGYAAILQMQKKQHCIICRAIGILLAIPFLERLIYRGILLGIGDTADFHLGFLDFFFLLLLAAAFWIWHLPKKQIQDSIRRTRGKLDLQAVNQYTFLPECIRMMSTSSLEKYQLEYENLTWIRCDKRWIVLYFARQDFTMLIDKQGFTHGTANACLAFLKNKQEGR